MPTSEEMSELVKAVAATGDRQAFGVLFKHFAPRVKAYLMRGGSSAATAEELAQEAMVVLWRKAGSFDPEKAGLATWLFTIARNLRIDRRRQHRDDGGGSVGGDAFELDDLAVDEAVTPDERLDARRREDRLRAALGQLSRDQVCVIQLSYYAERPHERIARELGLPLGTVKSRIRLAVNNLRRLIDIRKP